MRLSSRNDKVTRSILLKHQPHCLYKITSEAPIPTCFEVSKKQFLLQTKLNSSQTASDFSSYESLSAQRRFVVEKNSVRDEHSIRFAIVDGIPVRRNLAHRVGTPGMKLGLFVLRRSSGAEHF